MKPLGLDGKVGAPAIVRSSPLLERFISYADSVEREGEVAPEKLNSALAGLEYRWADVLDVVSYTYPARRGCLSKFLYHASARCIDRALVYDLDTPDLSIIINPRPNHRRVVSLRGACRFLSVSGSDDLVVSGVTGLLSLGDMLSVIKGRVSSGCVCGFSSIVLSPDGTVDELVSEKSAITINEPFSMVRNTSVVIADRPIPIGDGFRLYTTDDPRVRTLYLDCLSAAEDPAVLLRRSRDLRWRFGCLRDRVGEFRQDVKRNDEGASR